VAGRFAGRALTQEENVGNDGRPFAFEGVGGEADRANEISLSPDYSSA
jgi:hypothetical protein